MYFKDRVEAGRKLAEELSNYRYENSVLMALSEGGVVVGEQISAALHAPLTMLATEAIEIPGEQMQFGTVDQEGGFAYNPAFSQGESDYYYGEFHGYLDDQKRIKFQQINNLLGDGGILDKAILWDQNIILVSDGMPDAGPLAAAINFLKGVRMQKLVVATAIASVPAADRIQTLCDEVHILAIISNFLDTNHYFDDNTVPSREETVRKLNQAILNWH